jgi:predicted MFS family arabinose efflux permease
MNLNEPVAMPEPVTRAQPAPATPALTRKIPLRHWYALTILTLIYACHFLDRMMISLVVEPVRAEFHLTDSQIGLLTGLFYGVTFAIAGVPLGLLIDRVNRVKLMASLVAVWSAMTVLTASAHNFSHLLLARMGVGAAESGGSPSSLSLISDLFPPEKRSTAIGCFFLSNAVGALLCVVVGGLVTAHYGWRSAMLVAGAPGIVLALILLLTVREPKRGATDPATLAPSGASGLRATVRFVASNGPILQLLAGTTIAVGGVAAMGSWLPAYAMRFLHLDVKQAGFSLALATGLFGAFGSLFGGMISDRLSHSNPRRRMDLAMTVCVLAAIFSVTGIWLQHAVISVGLVSLSMMVAFGVFSSAFGAMLVIAGPNMRGTIAATMQICTNLVGYGLGPLAVGMLSDFYHGNLRLAMMTVLGICFPWAALHFWCAARAVARVR